MNQEPKPLTASNFPVTRNEVGAATVSLMSYHMRIQVVSDIYEVLL